MRKAEIEKEFEVEDETGVIGDDMKDELVDDNFLDLELLIELDEESKELAPDHILKEKQNEL